MYIKFHQMGDRNVIAICDENLLGKDFFDGDLHLNVSYGFYGGEKKREDYIKNILLKANNINLVGEKTIKLAIKLRIIGKKNVLYIDKIPYALIFSAI